MAALETGGAGRVAAAQWDGHDITALLSQAAGAMPAISATEAGTDGRSIGFTTTQHQAPINLGGGIPDPASLPADGLRAAIDRVLRTEHEPALRYGGVWGFEDLRDVLAERQGRIQGAALTSANFLLTHGGAGGIDAICSAFVDPGDPVIVERPHFSGSLRTLRGRLCRPEEADLGDDGAFPERVEEALQRLEREGQRAKLLYTVPDFHNPTGATMPLAVRERLVEVCARHRVFILEDMAYTELYFHQPPPPSLYALADGYGVIQVGSFSKVIATGLRVGWIQARPQVIDAIGRVRFDMGGSPLLHRALTHYVGGGELEPHVEALRGIYRAKGAALAATLREHCGPYLRFAEPEGGFFLWADCVGAPSQDVAREAAREGVTFATGANFYAGRDAADTSHVRLALSYASLEALAEVGPRLQRAIRRVVD